nr:POU domain, class 6, transcription factor 2 isoform X1 [Onthophagus taurus]
MAEGGAEEESGDMLGPATAPIHQSPSALNVKAEESDRESSCGSPDPATTMGVDEATDLHLAQKLLHGRAEEPIQNERKMSPPVATPTTHLNGAMAGLVTLQNLQNLATLQQTLPQVASLAAGLQNIANLATSSSASNAPLNLSVNATASSSPRAGVQSSGGVPCEPPSGLMGGNLNPQQQQQQQQAAPSIPPLMTSQQPAPMPQFILASGQLVQGIQGAQLLIPTSQGLATQTILTIPVNHVNSSDQIVNLALTNGQVVSTSLANLQAMAQPSILPANVPTTNGTIGPPPLLNPPNLTHLLTNNSTQQLLQTLPQMLGAPHPGAPPLLNPLAQPVSSLLTPPSTLLSTPSTQTNPNQSRSQLSINPLSTAHFTETKMHQPTPLVKRSTSPPTPNLSNLSRLATSNGELTITTSHGPNSSQNLKRSPSSLSPNCNDSSTADLLIDSPNQPTINQTNSNVVDGINLDEIKDFAKAFKLRRLSLGLTQTQVGQALSVTEGPAYSQSAICSALASQMFAAQLSSQQQSMFEKLDITPKSAQKIKPVLERWMKEAEESFSRYKSGQNHLTDFIGIEPSKKRKRRTSFTPQALELLNAHFERNTHPSGTEITGLAHQLGYEREVIRIWFCNKRQALKNTVRMMSKGMV